MTKDERLCLKVESALLGYKRHLVSYHFDARGPSRNAYTICGNYYLAKDKRVTANRDEATCINCLLKKV